jgi:hypothetical protein
VARKFSLKDNPIFQRLEIPKPLEAGAQSLQESPRDLIVESKGPLLPTIERRERERVENRPSKIDPHINPRNDHMPHAAEWGEHESQPEQNSRDNVDRENTSTDSSENLEGKFLTLKNLPSPDIWRPDSVVNNSPRSIYGDAIARPAMRDIHSDSSIENFSLPSPQHKIRSNSRDQGRSNFEAQSLRLKKNSSKAETNRTDTADDLVDGFDKSLFFSFYNEMNDDLLPRLDAAEQILYSRLFRLSYGFNKNYCTVSQPVLREKTGLSRNTIRTGLQMLVKKEWLRIIEAGNHVSTTYRVILLREKNSGPLFDGQKLTRKNRPSEIDPQNLRHSNRNSETELHGAQKKDLQNSTLKNEKNEIPNNIEDISNIGSNFEPQNSGTLTITNNILTLSESEVKKFNLENDRYHASATTLITNFYAKLGQEPSSAKRAKNLGDCIRLLRDGFSPDQIEYGINWLLSHHPETGSFSRVAHFIDQALKEREVEQQASLVQQKRRLAGEEEHQAATRSNEEAKQIESIKTSLTTETLTTLRDEAARLVDQEHEVPKYGRDTLIQIKLNELIRMRFLTS